MFDSNTKLCSTDVCSIQEMDRALQSASCNRADTKRSKHFRHVAIKKTGDFLTWVYETDYKTQEHKQNPAESTHRVRNAITKLANLQPFVPRPHEVWSSDAAKSIGTDAIKVTKVRKKKYG